MSKKKAYAVDVKYFKDGNESLTKVATFAETLTEVEEKVHKLFNEEDQIEITSVVQLEDFIVAE